MGAVKDIINLPLQMMARSGMLLTRADDEPDYCLVMDDPRRTVDPGGVLIAREMFDRIVASGLVERVAVIDGGEWYQVREDKRLELERRWATEA